MAGLKVRGYAICGEPRSGSNLLARLLASTGALGRPLEWFDRPAVLKSGVADWPVEPAAQVERIPTAGGSPNGVYGLKVFPYQFDRAKAARWASNLPDLHWVYLERRDLLGQAISLARANQTQAWTSADHVTRQPQYSAAAIDEALDELLRGRARWAGWFARNELRPLRLAYEDVAADWDKAVDAVAWLVGVKRPGIDDDLVDVKRQRDDVSDMWRQAYVAERRDLDAF